MKNCCTEDGSCQYCALLRLRKKYSRRIRNLESLEDCREIFRSIAQHCVGELSATPNSVYDRDAVVLIELTHNRIGNEDLYLVMQLCSVAIQSKLFLGLDKKTNSMEAGYLLSSFRDYLNLYKRVCPGAGEDYINSYCQYYSVRLQLFHLVEDYDRAMREYETRLKDDDIIQAYGVRIVSQYTASKWKGSFSDQDRSRSRDIAEDLMGHVKSRGISTEADYFIAAKYLEHHIQSRTPADGLKQIRRLLSPPEVDNILSSQDAISQTILYRDLYEASMRAGENDAEAHSYLSQAKEIAEVFNLRDQENKIRKVEKKLSEENSKMKYHFAHVNQVNIVEGDMKGSIVYGTQPSDKVDYMSLKTDIQQLMDSGTDAEKQALQEAVSAIDAKNENKFKGVLKKIADMFGDILTNVSSELLIAYMRQNGLIP